MSNISQCYLLIYCEELNEKLLINVENVVKHVRLKFAKRRSRVENSNFSKLVRINHPNNCEDVDIIEIAEKKGISLSGFNQIQFDFENIPGFAVEIKLQDRQSSLSRAFKYNKFSSSGPAIKFDTLSLPAVRSQYLSRFIRSIVTKLRKTQLSKQT